MNIAKLFQRKKKVGIEIEHTLGVVAKEPEPEVAYICDKCRKVFRKKDLFFVKYRCGAGFFWWSRTFLCTKCLEKLANNQSRDFEKPLPEVYRELFKGL